MLPVLLFGILVVVKKSCCGDPVSQQDQCLNEIPRFGKKSAAVTLGFWGLSMVFNLLTGLFEDADTSLVQPLYKIWCAMTGTAFYLTVALVAKYKKNYE